MIRRGVKIQLGVFALVTFLAIVYAGLSLVGVNVLHSPMRVTAHFADSGGIFSNAEVTYRGVNIGRVGGLHLTPDGVDVTLQLAHGTKVPADTIAVIADKSAVGEQYVDLQPRTDAAPYLHNGSSIAETDTRIPTPIDKLLLDLDRTSNSIGLKDLSIVVDELGKAFTDTGPSLDKLISNGDSLTQSLANSLPDTIRLINAGKVDLDTARATSGNLTAFSQGLRLLSDQLRASDPDVRRLLTNGVAAAHQLDDLLTAVKPDLYPLLGNLITVNNIQTARLPGLKQTLIELPSATARLSSVFGGTQIYQGLVNDPATGMCTYSTSNRLPADLSTRPTNVSQYCPDDNGTTDPRGARYAPRPPGDTTAGPGTDNGGGNSGPPSAVGYYDPTTSLAYGPDGQVVELGGPAIPAGLLGGRSWEGLLLALIRG